jgi:hypothetical protein
MLDSTRTSRNHKVMKNDVILLNFLSFIENGRFLNAEHQKHHFNSISLEKVHG